MKSQPNSSPRSKGSKPSKPRTWKPTIGQQWRIRKQYEKIGPPIIQVVAVDARRHYINVIDLGPDGSRFNPGWPGWSRKKTRPFQDSTQWPRLLKFWRLLRSTERVAITELPKPSRKAHSR